MPDRLPLRLHPRAEAEARAAYRWYAERNELVAEAFYLELDAAKRRLGLSMVERARQAKEAGEAEERRDTERVLARSSEKASLGTLADLLAKSRPPR